MAATKARTRKGLTQAQLERILRAAEGVEPRRAWSTARDKTGLHHDVVYRALSALGIIQSPPEIRARNRASVEKWLTESGAANPTPWKKRPATRRREPKEAKAAA